MRWKAYFYLNGENRTEKTGNFGLPSNKAAPAIKEMKQFEEDLVNLITNISFREVNDPFLEKVDNDVKKVLPITFLFSPIRQQTFTKLPRITKKLLNENITKSYKISKSNIVHDINEELRDISNHLSIGNRIDRMPKQNAFVTVKDHKENFPINLNCHLINPAKSELGKVSKIILDRINDNITTTMCVNANRVVQEDR